MEKKNDFKPFISADKVLPEFTVTSVILGMILAVIFGGANAYLGLRVGMTVSASIPAAVISMGVIRVILKKDSILENNMVQTIGSAGESLAAGAIFTITAIFNWASEKGSGVTAPSFVSIALIALCGGILGVLFMVPLRTALIVEEHGVLPYPEGTACAEVLLAGEQGGSKSKVVFAGLGIAAVYKFIADGLKLFPSEVEFSMQGQYTTSVGMDVLPALAGVGYICGAQVSSYIFAGGVLSYLVLIPAIAYFGGDSISKVVDETGKVLDTTVIYPTAPTTEKKIQASKDLLKKIIPKYHVSLISLGNGTASRESEQFIVELLKEIPEKVQYVIVNEAGASVYSASKLATEEFPKFDVGQRSAASIARRLQDPLAELVKIDPKSIGVGQYQHDMHQMKLGES